MEGRLALLCGLIYPLERPSFRQWPFVGTAVDYLDTQCKARAMTRRAARGFGDDERRGSRRVGSPLGGAKRRRPASQTNEEMDRKTAPKSAR
jgi:hypothetical protein